MSVFCGEGHEDMTERWSLVNGPINDSASTKSAKARRASLLHKRRSEPVRASGGRCRFDAGVGELRGEVFSSPRVESHAEVACARPSLLTLHGRYCRRARAR
jgi:hypothetical protein